MKSCKDRVVVGTYKTAVLLWLFPEVHVKAISHLLSNHVSTAIRGKYGRIATLLSGGKLPFWDANPFQALGTWCVGCPLDSIFWTIC